MKKYKVEITETSKYVMDVLAEDENQATDMATEKFSEICANGTYHYHQVGDTENEVSAVYDVTKTDDPFNP